MGLFKESTIGVKNTTVQSSVEHYEPPTEQDPNGIGQHDNGAKLDAGKPMAGRLLGMFGGAFRGTDRDRNRRPSRDSPRSSGSRLDRGDRRRG